jgi:parallel beta-helix repeat protein
MAMYYVRKDGHDTTGDGSSGAPWLTVHKGISTIAAGDTLLIGDGLYQEDTGSGYLYISRVFASAVTIRSESGDAAKVTIQGASSASYETMISVNGGSYVFEDLTFSTRNDTAINGAMRVARGTNVVFNRCRFVVMTHASTVRSAVHVTEGTGYTVQDVTFNDCVVEQIGSSPCYGFRVYKGTGTLDNINFVSCRVTATSYALYATGGTNIHITGGRYENASGLPALVYGKDAETSDTAVSGMIDGAFVRSNTSHSLLIGAGAAGVTARNCQVVGGDYGVVLKECAGNTLEANSISGGSVAAVLCKAAVNCIIRDNVLRNSAGRCVQLALGATGNRSSGLTVTGNRMHSSGAGKIYSWLSAADNGGCTVDQNVYDPKGSGKFGDVQAATGIVSLDELRAAWGSYSPAENEGSSRLHVDGDIWAVVHLRRKRG